MAFKDRTLPKLFYDLESSHPNKVFLRQPFGDLWEEYTYKEAGDKFVGWLAIYTVLICQNMPI